MPRIRTLKPEMAQDRKLASVSREARYTFVLLITQADDDGLQYGSRRQLLGSLYPHDADLTEETLAGWLDELSTIGVIHIRETNDGAPVVALANWSKHQRVVNRAHAVILPLLKDLQENGSKPHTNGAPTSHGPREPLVTSSAPDLRPSTYDLRPTTTDRAAAENVASHSDTPREPSDLMRDAVRVAVALNAAITERFGEQPTPIMASGAGPAFLLGELARHAIPLEFAVAQIPAIVARATEKPRSPKYLLPGIQRAWTEHQATADERARLAAFLAKDQEPVAHE